MDGCMRRTGHTNNQCNTMIPCHYDRMYLLTCAPNKDKSACASAQFDQNIGIKHGFSCINIRQVLWEMLKTEAGGRGFQHFPRELAIVNALKNHV